MACRAPLEHGRNGLLEDDQLLEPIGDVFLPGSMDCRVSRFVFHVMPHQRWSRAAPEARRNVSVLPCRAAMSHDRAIRAGDDA